MARIIPQNTGADIVSVAERWFLEAAIQFLDDEFVVFHSVPWVHVASQQLRQGECDFLILHPYLGFFSIETKPGDIRYDAGSGLWSRADGQHLKSDPYLQAQKSAHSISQLFSQKIKGWKEQQLPFGYAVYFCGADHVLGHLPTHALPALTLLQGDIPHLQQRLASIARHFGKVAAIRQSALIREAIAVLRPEFQLVQKFSTKMAMLEKELYRLTQRQIQVLDLLRDSRRVLVKGCAGSGKTILALEKAIRLARDGKRVLLLCYNIPLAEWLRTQLEKDQLDISVYHFHGLCQQFADYAELPYPIPKEDSQLSEFFDHEAPSILEQAIRNSAGPRYDAIIIDEGQDFIPDWWISIEELLEYPNHGLLYIFYDPEQNIFGRKFGFLIDEAKITLDRICRNTKQISAYMNRIAGTNHVAGDFAVEGLSPEEFEVESPAAELRRVQQIVLELVQQKKVSPHRIVVLGKRRRQNTAFAELDNLCGIPLVDEATEGDVDGKIRYATIFRFKGLEADCVIVIGFTRNDEGEANPMLYCAVSRAKFMLYVVYRTDT